MPDERRQFRILYRDFLSRMVDIEVLSARGDIQKLLAQFAALLAALSFILALIMVPRYVSSKLPAAKLQIVAWGDEEFLIGITIAVVGLFAVIAWNAVLPDRRDALVLGPLPVRLRTIFLAKIAAIATALGVSIGAVNVFTGLTLTFLVIPDGAGAWGLPRTFFAYWLTMLAAGVFVFAALLGVQGIAAQIFSYRLFQRISSFLQMAAFFVILAIFFLTPPLASVAGLSSPANQRILEFLPSYWFLGLFHRLNGSMHPVFSALAAHATRDTVLTFSIAITFYALAYYRHVRRIVEQPDIAAGSRSSLRLASRLTRFALPRPLDRAILLFTARTMARSRHHRFLLAAYGGVGLAIALAYAKSLIYGYSHEPWDQLNSPFLVGGFVVLLFAIVGARAVFALPVALPANWVFKITAIHSPIAYFTAVRRSLYILAAVPVWLVATTFYLAVWPGRPAAEHIVVLIAAGIFMVERALVLFRKIPFTCSYLPGSGNLTVRFGIYAIVFLVISETLFGQAEFALLHRLSGFALAAGVLVTLAAWRRWRTTRYANAYTQLQFEELPPAELFSLDLKTDPGSNAPQSYIAAVDRDPRLTTPKLVAAAVALLPICGFSYEQFGQWRDHRRSPQIGRSFDIGGRKLNIYCSGEGSPAVIFDSGQSMPGVDWALVQPEIAMFTRACWYDRAGLGWSDSGPYPGVSDSSARDLHALLAAAQVPQPYILVGHSMGGYDVRVYRGLYPNEVAGMVLVDAAHEDAASQTAMPNVLRRVTAGVLAFAARFGVLRLIAPSPDPAPGRFTRDQWAEIWSLRWQPKSVLAAVKDSVDVSAAQARAAGNFGDLPLIVLTAGKSGPEQDIWNELQAELAWRSTRGRQVIVPDAGNMIPEQAPEAVTQAVYEIFSEIRTRP
jgi:pimeloyl-ACP methyl ester carboxylesterase